MYINEKTFSVHPESTKTEKEMQSYLFLEENGVEYIRAEHDEAATIELCEDVEKVIDAKICKNLLLCNRQQTKFYMLLIPGDMPFKTKYLSAQINSSRLSFASGEQMEQLLNVSPGSLTVLSLMFDKAENVELLIEKKVFNDEYFACHPCVNTATVKFKTADLKDKVLPALNRSYTVVDLECHEDEI
jgi:Ala-tRNA(Pro) deacylase